MAALMTFAIFWKGRAAFFRNIRKLVAESGGFLAVVPLALPKVRSLLRNPREPIASRSRDRAGSEAIKSSRSIALTFQCGCCKLASDQVDGTMSGRQISLMVQPMSRKTEEEDAHASLLAAAMRAIRKARRMRTSEVAQAMGMPVRSYEHFEAGKGRITFARLARFAEVTNSDPVALLSVVPMNSPEFALRCADNKLMQILMIALSDLNEDLSEDIVYLESALIIGGITRLCKELTEHVRRRDTFAETWLEQKSSNLRGMISDRKPVKNRGD